ncbi:MAG: glycoside hydrolase family 26 protein [Ruminococcus sp.]|nr:glycoside hydrolase family 26 protein [Ruminococcus sp.]
MKKAGVAMLSAAMMISAAFAGYLGTSVSDINTYAAYESKYTLSNSDANEITSKVYDYLCDSFGNTILAGQQESTWMGSVDYEMNYIENNTGKLPAIRGLDFMGGDFDGVVKRSKDWWEKGGIVTICWHTGVNGGSYNDSLNDSPNFSKLLTKGTSEYNAMIANWDKAAEALKELRDAGVPVLWRPFHEFDGQWFWWGKGGSSNFVKLWQMMYDYFTDVHGLDNLIWVLGYADSVTNGWYPGDEYCDIIGSDTYNNSNLTHKNAWTKLNNMNTDMPIAFHECGNLPTVEALKSDGCMWSWFMVWHTSHITNNNKTNLNNLYNSELITTLDELPDFATYNDKEDENSSSENSIDNDSSSMSESNSDIESSSEIDSINDSNEDSSSKIDNINTSSQAATTSSSLASTNPNKTNSDRSPNTGIAFSLSTLAITASALVVIKKKNDK